MSKILVLAMVAVTVVAALRPLSRAQTTAAVISGTLADETGGELSGVQVTITNVATGIHRTVLSDSTGRYTVPQLPPGPYEVTATMAGFETLVRKEITLYVGQEVILTRMPNIARI